MIYIIQYSLFTLRLKKWANFGLILECAPMPNVMVALPKIDGALCSTPQSLADAHYWTVVQKRCQDAKPVEITWGAPNYRTDLSR